MNVTRLSTNIRVRLHKIEAIVDHESHPQVYSSLSFTWDRETKTKAQGLLSNLTTLGFVFTFLNPKNSRKTLKR